MGMYIAKEKEHGEIRVLKDSQLDAVSGGTTPIKGTVYAIGRIEPRFPRL